MAGTLESRCPTCGTKVVWNEKAKWRPFCSERCRMIDLGDWLDERHRIPEETDEEEGGKPFQSSDEG